MAHPILIVDDTPSVRDCVNGLLSQAGFHTLQAHDGIRALATVRGQDGKISLLLTDVEMDGMSGITLAQSVVAEYPAIPVLFMSGGAVSQRALSVAVPGSVLIQKPFHAATLIQVVKALIRAQQ
jgi:CheY-like chemotaxis protein